MKLNPAEGAKKKKSQFSLQNSRKAQKLEVPTEVFTFEGRNKGQGWREKRSLTVCLRSHQTIRNYLPPHAVGTYFLNKPDRKWEVCSLVRLNRIVLDTRHSWEQSQGATLKTGEGWKVCMSSKKASSSPLPLDILTLVSRQEIAEFFCLQGCDLPKEKKNPRIQTFRSPPVKGWNHHHRIPHSRCPPIDKPHPHPQNS